jgi:threonylcarbamoyladenosine tRNA methylthiotransferase MtaB
MLRILSKKKLNHFYHQHLGTTQIVLLESEEKDGMTHGFSENYIKVKVPFDPSLVNQLVEIELNKIDDDMCVAGKTTESLVIS